MVRILWGLLLLVIVLVPVFIVALVPAIVLKLLRLRKASDAIVYWCISMLCNFALLLCGVKVQVSGDMDGIRSRIKNGEGMCFICNHTSYLDIITILAKLRVPVGFVAKRELVYVPILNILIWLVNSIFIDRKSLKKSVKSIRKATDNIRKGYSMVIFPEGTRSKTGEIAAFKHGSFRMATESGADIVPITVKGLRSGLEERKHVFQRTSACIDIGKPVDSVPSTDREGVSVMIAKIEDGIRETYQSL